MVELVDVLIDDGAGFARTVEEVLAGEGVELRPGSLAQVVGASAGWALATLLEGHGRDADPATVRRLVGEVQHGWDRVARSQGVRLRSGALAAVRAVADRRPVGLLTALPEAVATTLLATAGAVEMAGALIIADGDSGLPRPGALVSWLAGTAAPGATGTTALMSSAPALLAAIGAGFGDVVLVGEGNPAAVMLAERRVTSIEAGLADT